MGAKLPGTYCRINIHVRRRQWFRRRRDKKNIDFCRSPLFGKTMCSTEPWNLRLSIRLGCSGGGEGERDVACFGDIFGLVKFHPPKNIMRMFHGQLDTHNGFDCKRRHLICQKKRWWWAAAAFFFSRLLRYSSSSCVPEPITCHILLPTQRSNFGSYIMKIRVKKN